MAQVTGYSFPNAHCVDERDQAVQVAFGSRLEWIPKKALHDDSEVYHVDHSGKLVVKAFFAELHHWEDDAGVTVVEG